MRYQAVGVGIMLLGVLLVPLTVGAPRALLEFEPKSHDFGEMFEGETNSTVFLIWCGEGCCSLTYSFTWSAPWIDVFPTSGMSVGEQDPITVTIDTTGLGLGTYAEDITINSDGGTGYFTVTVDVVGQTYPNLAYYPQSHHFGTIPEGTVAQTTFEIWNTGTGIVTYDLSWGAAWVTVDPVSGTSSGEHDTITVGIDTTGLITGETYQESIAIASNGGNKVFTVLATIGTLPCFEIGEVSGGLFHVNAEVLNTGTADAVGVNWSISVEGTGLVLLGKQSTGRLPGITIGSLRTISSGLILGLGDVTITVTAGIPGVGTATKDVPAKLFLFYIKML